MNSKTYLRLLGVSLLCLAEVGAWAQAPAPGLPKKDADAIRFMARKKIEKDLPGLLNTLSFEDISEFERDAVIKNSFLPNANQVFFNDEVILEDDIEPDHLNHENVVDMPVEKYLRNLDLFYVKTAEPSIRFSNLVVAPVQSGDGFHFVKVFFTSKFSSKHTKLTNPYLTTSRVAELRAEKDGGKWTVLITRLAFRKPDEDLSRINKPAVVAAAKPIPDSTKAAPVAKQSVPEKPFVYTVKSAPVGFVLRGDTARVWVKWDRAAVDVVRSGVPQLKPGLFRRQEGTYAQRYLQGCCTAIEFESKSRFVFRTVEGFLYFDRAVGPPAKPAATLSQSSQPRPDLATTAPPADKPISRPVETPEPTTEPEKAVSEPAKTTAISGNTTPEPTQPEAAAPSESVVKTPEPPPVLKVPEVKPKAVPALQKSLDAEQKRQAARYRTQGWLQLAAGVAGLAGGYVIHSKIKSDYAGYTTKVDALNVEYDAWRELIRTPTGSRMTPMSITQYGSPGIYAAYGAGAAGLGLSVNGVLKLMKAGRVGRNYLSKPKP